MVVISCCIFSEASLERNELSKLLEIEIDELLLTRLDFMPQRYA